MACHALNSLTLLFRRSLCLPLLQPKILTFCPHLCDRDFHCTDSPPSPCFTSCLSPLFLYSYSVFPCPTYPLPFSPSLPVPSTSPVLIHYTVPVFLPSCSVMFVGIGDTLMKTLSPVEYSVLSLWVFHPKCTGEAWAVAS